MKRAVLALSGGMDSSTVLGWLLANDYKVIPVTFYYGSKHNCYELKCAEQVMRYYGLSAPWHHFDLRDVFTKFRSDLLLDGGDIPEGHYTDETMSATVVPGRNSIFLSILAGLAWSVDANYIALGIHQGDHAIYADCRKEFYKAMDAALFLGTDRRVEFLAPFLEGDKEQILEWGLANGVPYRMTRTCYKDQPVSCGVCGSCVERLEAFAKIGKEDPVDYV